MKLGNLLLKQIWKKMQELCYTNDKITTNVCVDDRLSNGQLGIVRKIEINNQNQVEKIYIEFDDSCVGLRVIFYKNLQKIKVWYLMSQNWLKFSSNVAFDKFDQCWKFQLDWISSFGVMIFWNLGNFAFSHP